MMQEFRSNETVLARFIRSDEQKDGLNFFSADNEYIQVGTWSYEKGKQLPAHIHNIVNRVVPRTCEVLYVISGSIEAHIFDESSTEIASPHVRAGDILILLAGAHGYRILEDGTKVLEVKNGPYPGAEQDRRRI